VTVRGGRLELAEAAGLVRPRDTVACDSRRESPSGLLDAIGARPDLEDLTILRACSSTPMPFWGTRPSAS